MLAWTWGPTWVLENPLDYLYKLFFDKKAIFCLLFFRVQLHPTIRTTASIRIQHTYSFTLFLQCFCIYFKTIVQLFKTFLFIMFFQAYSYGGTTGLAEADHNISNMTAVKSRPLKIRFNADTASSMQWNFKPQQHDITVSRTGP